METRIIIFHRKSLNKSLVKGFNRMGKTFIKEFSSFNSICIKFQIPDSATNSTVTYF